jgi:hypothetical protein
MMPDGPSALQNALDALDGREADVIVEAKGKEQALVPLGVRIW